MFRYGGDVIPALLPLALYRLLHTSASLAPVVCSFGLVDSMGSFGSSCGSVDSVGYSPPLLQPSITLFTSTALALVLSLPPHADFLQPIQAEPYYPPFQHCPIGLLLQLTLSHRTSDYIADCPISI
eukprot:g43894.t1